MRELIRALSKFAGMFKSVVQRERNPCRQPRRRGLPALLRSQTIDLQALNAPLSEP